MTYGTLLADAVQNTAGDVSSGLYGFKNRIINGDMRIDQRNAGASVTAGSGYTFFVDRFKIYSAASSKLSGQQVASSYAGFPSALRLTSLAATSPAAGDEYELYHNIEGYNITDLAWGTAAAKPITLSFVVNSSLTGTFAGCINNNSFGGTNTCYVFTYAVNVANTDTLITVTIPGPTSGSWGTTNGTGMQVIWDLGSGSGFNSTAGSWGTGFKTRTSGSVTLVGTSGATFQITGVQLEKGTQATSFDFRSIGTELALCQRYYEKSYNVGTAPGTVTTQGSRYSSGSSGGLTTSFLADSVSYKVPKRSRGNTLTVWDNGGNANVVTRHNYGVLSTNSSAAMVGPTVNDEIGFDIYSSGSANAMVISYQWTCSSEL